MSTRRPSWWRKRADTDFHAEIQAHLELEADRLAADDKVDPAEARLRARKAFGNVLAAEERFYESSRWMWLDQLRQDIRYACRTLWRSRTFVSTTVLTLAVALGLLTVLFAVFNAYVLRPFAIHDPYRVYQLAWQSPGGGGYAFTWRNYEELRDRHDLFDDVAAHRWQMVASTSKERQGRQLYAAFVSGNYFDTLRPHVRLGRALAAFDTATPGGAPVAVLSDQGWATLFDRDPHVLGRRVELNDRTFEVVGVLRPEFSGMDDTPLDVWLPLTMLPAVAGKDVFGAMQPPELTLFARLRTDVAPAQAAQALLPFMVRAATAQAARSAATQAAASDGGGDVGGRTLNARDVSADLRLRATPNPLTVDLIAMLSPVFAAFGLVLVAACANVSNVMLARAIARHREIGIRLSVGASRARIVRQLLTEALVISTLAGLAGLAFASLTLQAGRRLFFATLPASVAELARVVPLEIDYRVFLFALGVASVATLFCALMPALQATRLSLTDALRGQAAPGVRSGTLRNLLVAGQVTVSLVLLIAAATLSRNGVTLAATDLGFDTRGVFSINNRGDNDTLIPSAVQALASDPQSGVSDIAVTRRNPLFGRFETMAVQPATREETLTTMYAFVSPEYFRVLRIPILRGRTFRANEAETEAHVGIVSARGAQAFWPGMDPIGQVMRVVRPGAGAASSNNDSQTSPDLDGYSDIVIVGVAKDVTSGFVYDGHDPALVYLPTSRTGKHAGALLVRGRDTGALQRETLQRVLERVHRDRLVFETIALGEMKDVMLYPLRAVSWIGALLGLIALALSVSGLYGVLTYVLGQRTREIGIRMALGATAAGVVRLMMHQSARIVLLGAAFGVVFAFTTLKLLGALVSFRNVSLLDPWSFAIGLTLIAAAALFATYFPARRATRVDPSKTLRADA